MTHKKKDKKKGFGWGGAAVAAGAFLALIGMKKDPCNCPAGQHCENGVCVDDPTPGTTVKIWFRNINENAKTYFSSNQVDAAGNLHGIITSASGENEVRSPVSLVTEREYYIYGNAGSGANAQCQIGTEQANISGLIVDPGNTQPFTIFVNDVNSGPKSPIIEGIVHVNFVLLARVRFATVVTTIQNIGASAF